MGEFVEAARLDHVAQGTGISITVAGKDLARFNVDGVLYAIDDVCLHAGASLGSGQREGKTVTCLPMVGNMMLQQAVRSTSPIMASAATQ
jgi:nitrite reductase/ring-hydroxylating ferredoxin subunit